ncbi:MAG: M15 family metallopeptidase [Candidatus Babeliales bacterium]
MKKLFGLSLLCSLIISCSTTLALTPETRAKGFVYLHEIDPTIKTSLRYNSNENFVGTVVDGYKKNVVIMTKQAAQALKKVQEEVKKDGYSLVVYDAYRPQQAVDHFMRWSKDVKDQAKKDYYYPRIDKARVFELGYVAERSGHSRGSTVDLTLIKNGQSVHDIKTTQRTLLDNFSITYLDDGTVDMGSSFDLFDVASHYENNLIAQEYKARRTYLKNIMEKHGFKNYSEEWWHFTLKNEPFPANQDSSYFNFPVE